jgi:hypothetical protein
MSPNRPASRQTGKRAARGLGRGLSSLLGDNAIAQATAAPATASGSVAGGSANSGGMDQCWPLAT